jgi:hypothetical protein
MKNHLYYLNNYLFNYVALTRGNAQHLLTFLYHLKSFLGFYLMTIKIIIETNFNYFISLIHFYLLKYYSKKIIILEFYYLQINYLKFNLFLEEPMFL